MTTLEVLTAARAKIEKGWSKGGSALLSDGRPTLVSDEEAEFFCMTGAIHAVTCEPREARSALKALRWVCNAGPRAGALETYNDAPATKKEDVVSAYDRAIIHMQGVKDKS